MKCKKKFQARLADMAVLYNPKNRIQQTIDPLYPKSPIVPHRFSSQVNETMRMEFWQVI